MLVVVLVDDCIDIVVDFCEKLLCYVCFGDCVVVVFDVCFGEVFGVWVVVIDVGVKEGQLDVNGDFVVLVIFDCWVCDVQCQCLYVVFDEFFEGLLFIGVKVIVQFYFGDGLSYLFGCVQIVVISLLYYVY